MALKIVEEMSLGNFKAWSGGASRLAVIKELDVVNEAEDYIIEMYGSDVMDATTLNDILWFEMDEFIAQYDKNWA